VLLSLSPWASSGGSSSVVSRRPWEQAHVASTKAQACYIEPEESPMHEDEETVPIEEEEQEQEQPMEKGDDDPHLDLEGD